MGVKLTKHRSVSHDFALDALDLAGEAEVNHFVDIVILSAFVFLKCFGSTLVLAFFALNLLITAVTLLRRETFALSPGKDTVHSASLAAIAGLIAVQDFLG